MSLLADIANAPTEITFRGVVYEMRELNIIERSMHSRWLEKRAFDAVARQTQLPLDVRERLERGVAQDIAAGTYEYGGEAYIRSLATIHGWANVLHLLFRNKHPGANYDFCVEMVTELVANKLTADLEKMKKAMDDPGNSSGRAAPSDARPTSTPSSAPTPSETGTG